MARAGRQTYLLHLHHKHGHPSFALCPINLFPGWQHSSFCAPIQALCTEASLKALRRRYPQIYESEQKLLLDARLVHVDRRDFMAAFSAIVPASHRSSTATARCPALVM